MPIAREGVALNGIGISNQITCAMSKEKALSPAQRDPFGRGMGDDAKSYQLPTLTPSGITGP
jgi:hypothetical protein